MFPISNHPQSSATSGIHAWNSLKFANGIFKFRFFMYMDGFNIE